jgi:subfamily B ATP-binding cassette protein MsbA
MTTGIEVGTAADRVPLQLRASGAETAPLGARAIVKRLFKDYVRDQWPTLALAIGCMLITALANTALAYLLDPAIKYVFLKKDAAMLLPVSIGAFLIIVIRAGAYFSQLTLNETLGERIVMRLQRDMFDGLMRRDLASLNSVHSGQFVSSFLYDATQLRDAFGHGIANIALEGASLTGFAVLMIYQDWKLAMLSIVVLPGVAWAMERIGSSLRRATKRSMEETGEVSTALVEALDGRRVIKAYGLEAHATERAEARLATRLKYLLKAVRARAAAAPAADLFAGVVVAGTVYYAGYQTLHGELEFNRLVSFLAAMLLAQTPVRNMSQYWATLSSGLAAANRIFAVIDAKPKIVDKPQAKTLSVERAPKGGRVRFDQVGFSYGSDSSTPAIDRISFDVAPGQKVALVGPSGAGKTTIFNLLLRFYDIDSGAIEIDGIDIRDVTLNSLRANMALVTQDPILFDESIADNIALGRPGASLAEIEGAARAAAAHGFISALPNGYQTQVGEGGLKLSGGERQRIAIARAMLRNAPILLLDEATSSLDTESERQVQDALTTLMANRTTIVIAHRLSTVQDAHMIHVVSHGRVIESGRHAELVAHGGLYSRLYQLNFDERVPAIENA